MLLEECILLSQKWVLNSVDQVVTRAIPKRNCIYRQLLIFTSRHGEEALMREVVRVVGTLKVHTTAYLLRFCSFQPESPAAT